MCRFFALDCYKFVAIIESKKKHICSISRGGENVTNLHDIRVRRGLSQTELARLVNCSRLSISRWEQGVTIPSGKNLLLLAQILHVTPNELLAKEEANDTRHEKSRP